MDYSKCNDRFCINCRSSDKWPPYDPAKVLVCRHDAAIRRHGGPRSCQDIVRAPGGLCGPDGTLWAAKQ